MVSYDGMEDEIKQLYQDSLHRSRLQSLAESVAGNTEEQSFLVFVEQFCWFKLNSWFLFQYYAGHNKASEIEKAEESLRLYESRGWLRYAGKDEWARGKACPRPSRKRENKSSEEKKDQTPELPRCECGASLVGEVWADQGLCQMCWEKHCSDEFWRQINESDAALGSLVLFGLVWGVVIGIGIAALIAWLIW